MARIKFDGVVEAVRYKPSGEIDWVRAYERRGPTFSDYILLDRETLIKRIKAGKRYVSGKRIPYMASTFETSSPIRLVTNSGKEIVVTSDPKATQDRLEGVPTI
ncbi:MAG TPA: hypothetical protein VIS10_18635 [Anaerolineales bacterium]